MSKVFTGILWVILVTVVLQVITPTDPTDNSRWDRSGLMFYIDHGTGCQYVEGGLVGGITPRLDAQGRHMGCR